jgi:hypothetical protein
MKICLTYSQLPELREFSPIERKEIYAQCIHPMLMSWPARTIKYIFTLSFFFYAIFTEFWDSIYGYIGFVAFYILVDHLLELATIYCMRHHLRKSLAQRRVAEIDKGQQAAPRNR